MSKLKLFLILASALLISCNPNDPNNGNDTGTGGGGTGTGGGNGGGGVKPSWYLSDADQGKVYQPNPVIVFDSKVGDIYRIAGIVETTKGTLVAVSDSRKTSEADVGFNGAAGIDVVVKRSTDGGKTWGQAVKIPPIATKKEDSHGDPLIFSCKDGTLVVLCAAGNAWAQKYSGSSLIKMSKSTDDGQSWSQWTEIQKVIYDNATVKTKGFVKGFAASGRGYTDPDTGALYAAVLVGNTGHSKKGTVVIKSVDNGTTWTVIGVLEDNGNDEPKVVTRIAEGTHAGKLLLSVRPSTAGKRKFFLLDETQGEATSISTYNEATAGTFNDPTIDAEGMRYTLKEDGHAKNRILHVYLNSSSGRKNLSLVMSENEGVTWANNKQLQDSSTKNAAYSSIMVLGDGTIGILAEEQNLDTASASGTYDIVFRRFNLKAFNGETYTQTW